MDALRFDDFEFDRTSNTLTQAGQVVPIEPQVGQVLNALMTNHGKIISREQLLSDVWGGRAVSPAVVDNRIRAARLALNDDGRHQKFIKTHVNKGFMFVEDVLTTNASEHSDTVRSKTGAETSFGWRFINLLTQSKRITLALPFVAMVATSFSVAEVSSSVAWHSMFQKAQNAQTTTPLLAASTKMVSLRPISDLDETETTLVGTFDLDDLPLDTDGNPTELQIASSLPSIEWIRDLGSRMDGRPSENTRYLVTGEVIAANGKANLVMKLRKE
ncbi:winged helix-turn-helix domain-containing protein [Tateyamaria sp. SN3-11]|uniref:winged helix-turn-helix domain-containing protein n=1 Tax=Tateyamaria sp. SN3-11 TaxID=3092147 RepID=UPI0039E95671